MKYRNMKLHCSERLLSGFSTELQEIDNAIQAVKWEEEFSFHDKDKIFTHQRAYNKALEREFLSCEWETQPKLSDSPKLIGDFRKSLVFVEVQFGNSATLYRDFYKFQYGLHHGLVSLAILIVPDDERAFFPTRTESVRNMANYQLAERYLTVLPINVPTCVFGLLPEN